MLIINPAIATTVVLGVSLFLMLSVVVALLIFRYKHNQQKHFIEIQQMELEFEKQLAQSQIEVQEITFTSLARELHDNVGQLLSTSNMLLGITERQMPQPPDTLVTAHETLTKAIRELRTLSKSLSKDWLEQFDLIENLSKEIERLDGLGSLIPSFITEANISMAPDQQIILFRIIQEALQNALKHANAQNLIVKITEKQKSLHICIQDDGKGFDPDHLGQGIGLMNIRHRVRVLQGQVEWVSSLGQGTTINIIIPTTY